jgi:hypothetical protein
VDIYNVTSGNWTTSTLSIPRYELAATSSQNLVFFGILSNVVDVIVISIFLEYNSLYTP